MLFEWYPERFLLISLLFIVVFYGPIPYDILSI